MKPQAVDFLRVPGLPRVGWYVLALGMSGLAAALLCQAHWASQRAAVLRAEQQALARQQELNAPPPPVAPTLAERRWQQAQVELRRPWLPTLRAIEATTQDPVYLLSLSIAPSTGQIRLDAEASSFDQAVDYVQALGSDGVLQQAMLSSHVELPPALGSRPTVKFSAIAHWASPHPASPSMEAGS